MLFQPLKPTFAHLEFTNQGLKFTFQRVEQLYFGGKDTIYFRFFQIKRPESVKYQF